ncbi:MULTISPECIES: amidohydrolase [Microbacterium]|uniref:Amidohydrolase n=1 Tax=Microbacterium wangchenii TaxID=2541726 RepID=A0ABX5SUF8_9MICO|nr:MULTISPECIES: amidohydrolase [Microbacterium]MCK6067238.1 amidohydrolase [Microbacterium sp. EYE_512]QBR89813.1 amidohydrolase [Microbacterium wangchenii]TXK16589.1 amidohydrolase [Microbacterium wangchenii]
MTTVLRNAWVGGGDVLDVRVENGAITQIGAGLERSAEEVELDGRILLPGMWDNHVHFTQWAMVQQRVDLSGARSAAEAAALVTTALADSAESPLIGFGFRDGLWPDAPTRTTLDDAAGRHPVVLVSADLHTAWLNSAALERYGHADHPTGLLQEEPAFEVTRRIGTVPEATLDAWAATAGVEAARRGVVGVVDLEMTWNLDPWVRRTANGFESLRVEFGIYTRDLERAIGMGLRTGMAINDLVTVGGYKVLTDGSLNTRTAFCHDEYPGLEGQPNSRGLLEVPPERLVPLMRRASEAGLVPDVHAIGDRANTLALDAFEALGIGGRIEHAQLLDESDVGRFAKLGVVASVQPEHAMDDRDVADRYWAGKTARSFALKTLLDAGAELALGSDAPVAPLDPWVTLAAAVDRSRDGRPPWHPEQAISVEAALAASTRTRVQVGQPADLIVVERDPFHCTSDELRSMPVAATMLGGRFTHRTL